MTAKAFINPPCSTLGPINAILTGTSRSHYVPESEGTLSIKTVISGSAVWHAGGRNLVVRDDCFLVLNDRQRYAVTIESPEPTTTFCVFFARGFVEDIWRTMVTSDSKLLDHCGPRPKQPGPGFFERLEMRPNSVLPSLLPFYDFVSAGNVTRARWNAAFLRVATELVVAQRDVLRGVRRIPAAKGSTRMELCKRLLRGRDFLISSWDRQLKLEDIAYEACLSPYHFHRAFTQFFGRTPHRFLTDYRLDRVATQLRDTRRSITDLCFGCGFESLPSFSSLFRRRYAVSPREYRRAMARNSKIRKIG